MKKKKYFIFALAIIIVCYATSFVMSFLSLRSVIQDNSRQIRNVIAERIYDAINSELTKSISVSKAMASDLFLLERLKQEQSFPMEKNIEDFSAYLEFMRHDFAYQSTFLVSEYSHCYYTHKGLNKIVDIENDPHDIWYKLFIEHGKDYDLNVDEDQVTNNKLTVFINKRVEDADGNYCGACGMGMQMDYLLDIVRENEARYHVDIDILDGEGKVLVDADAGEKVNTDKKEAFLGANHPNDNVFKLEGENLVGTRYVENLSWYLVITNEEEFGTSAYTQLMYLYLAVFLVLVFLLFVAITVVMRRERMLYMSSAIDVMTDLSSRRSYEEYLQDLTESKKQDVTYVSLDLNALKRVNDKIGHQAGDEMINGAGRLIRQYFAKLGHSYRIGGDEFAVIIAHCDIDKEKTIREFKELVAEWHGTLVDSMSFSIGIVRGCDYPSAGLQKLIELADIEMYKDKEIFYQQSGLKRR